MSELTAKTLREILSYDPETGQFTWLKSKARWIKPGTKAGSYNSDGYELIRIDGRSYGTQRLAFLFMTGSWPASEMDHIDGDRKNNKWANLREATRAQNCRNKPARGAYKSNSRWRATIGKKNLGTFDTEEEALLAYKVAAREAYGEFVRA